MASKAHTKLDLLPHTRQVVIYSVGCSRIHYQHMKHKNIAKTNICFMFALTCFSPQTSLHTYHFNANHCHCVHRGVKNTITTSVVIRFVIKRDLDHLVLSGNLCFLY